MKQKLTIRSLTIAVGLTLAVVMMLTQLFHSQATGLSKKETRTEQKGQHSEEAFISLSSFSLPSASVHVEVNLNPYCLFEILFEKETRQTETSRVPLHPEKLLLTLFRVIISPNAP